MIVFSTYKCCICLEFSKVNQSHVVISLFWLELMVVLVIGFGMVIFGRILIVNYDYCYVDCELWILGLIVLCIQETLRFVGELRFSYALIFRASCTEIVPKKYLKTILISISLIKVN